MLMLPASNVSVPLTVVMRTRSRMPERVLDPPPRDNAILPGEPKLYVAVQMFEPRNVKTIVPDKLLLALLRLETKPDVYDAPTTEAAAINPAKQTYPVVSMPPALPSCTCGREVPPVLTPLNITVTRFAQLGILVKSIAVPLVDATAVPLLMMLLGAAMVVVPSVFRTTLLLPELGFLRLVAARVLMAYS